MTVGKESSKQMHHEICWTAMTRVLDLRNILELVDNGLDDRSFAQQQFVRQMHEMILHVFAQPGDQLESLFKEQSRQGSGNVATIPKQFAAQSLHQLRNRYPIIDIAWSQATRQQLAAIIYCQMQFKAEEPTHARLASLGIGRKDAVPTDPFGITDLQRGRINEADACTSRKSALQVGKHRNQDAWNEGDKALITHQTGKFAGQMHLNMFGVIGFERPIVRLMKMDENRHHLTWAQLACALSLLASLHLPGFPLRCKAEQEVVDITKQFE